jgi:hypothetical protein
VGREVGKAPRNNEVRPSSEDTEELGWVVREFVATRSTYISRLQVSF